MMRNLFRMTREVGPRCILNDGIKNNSAKNCAFSLEGDEVTRNLHSRGNIFFYFSLYFPFIFFFFFKVWAHLIIPRAREKRGITPSSTFGNR